MSDVSLDELRALQDDLQALGRAEASVDTPLRVREAVLAGWDAAHEPHAEEADAPAARRPWWVAAAGLAAAAAVLAALLWPRPQINPGLISGRQEINPGLISQGARPAPVQVQAQTVATAPEARAAVTAARSRAVTVAAPDHAQWLVIGQPIADDERITVVRVRMAATHLAALGIETESGERASETIDVDLLVAEDGVTRGVRVW